MENKTRKQSINAKTIAEKNEKMLSQIKWGLAACESCHCSCVRPTRGRHPGQSAKHSARPLGVTLSASQQATVARPRLPPANTPQQGQRAAIVIILLSAIQPHGCVVGGSYGAGIVVVAVVIKAVKIADYNRGFQLQLSAVGCWLHFATPTPAQPIQFFRALCPLWVFFICSAPQHPNRPTACRFVVNYLHLWGSFHLKWLYLLLPSLLRSHQPPEFSLANIFVHIHIHIFSQTWLPLECLLILKIHRFPTSFT